MKKKNRFFLPGTKRSHGEIETASLNLVCGLGCVSLCMCAYCMCVCVHTHVPHPVLCGWRCCARWNKLYSNKTCSFRLNTHLTLAPLSLFIAVIKTHIILKDFNEIHKCHLQSATAMIHFHFVQLHFDWFIIIFCHLMRWSR